MVIKSHYCCSCAIKDIKLSGNISPLAVLVAVGLSGLKLNSGLKLLSFRLDPYRPNMTKLVKPDRLLIVNIGDNPKYLLFYACLSHL